MDITGGSVTVGTLPTALNARDDRTGMSLLIQNTSDATVYVGGIALTASAYGHAIAPNGTLSVDIPTSSILYAVVASGTKDVRVLAVPA
jgi:hypothetical protein